MRTATPYPSTSRIDIALDFFPLEFDVEAISASTSHDESYRVFPARNSISTSTEDSFSQLTPFSFNKPSIGPCGVCGDVVDQAEAYVRPNCTHIFCKTCLRSYVLVKVQERQYPINCPGCVAERYTSNYLEEDILYNLGIPPKETEILVELQLLLHLRTVTCPKCKKTTNIGRQDYFDNLVLTCSSIACALRWCRDCGKEIEAKDVHHCKNKKLDRLMRRKGWRYCPGCRTPIQKETGCNHMTCGAPGCRVHFCYRCGDLIFDMARNRSDGLSAAISAHYSRCRQYPLLSTYTLARAIPSRCSIQ